MKHVSLLFFLSFILIFFSGCKEEPVITPVPEISEEGIFLVNEGNFTFGNGSLSYLDLGENKIYNQVFFNVNGFPLGDVPQSLFLKGDSLFIVVNNSGKIVVMDINDFKHINTIDGLVSPRYILPTKGKEAYVSDLYNNNITVIDLETLQKTSTIDIGHSSETMLLHEGYAYVTGWTYGESIYKIDINTNQLAGKLEVGVQPNSLVTDRNNDLWVLCDGGFQGSPHAWDFAGLYQIDLTTFTVKKTIRFDHKDYNPKALKINADKDTLFFLSAAYGGPSSVEAGIFKMGINETTIPVRPFIKERGGFFYNFGISPVGEDIYVSDALDYTRAGWLWRFTRNGTVRDSFRVDIIPGEMLFKTR